MGQAPPPVSLGEPDRHQPIGDGERVHKISLRLLFLGLPLAIFVAGIWEVVVGVSSMDANPRVTGWRAVLYDLPASLLLLGVVTASLVFAAKALRADARGASWGLWLSGTFLLLTLLYLGTTTADTVSTPSSATLNWVVRAAMVPVAATATFLARRWARPPASRRTDPRE